jgi:hypothetical protein
MAVIAPSYMYFTLVKSMLARFASAAGSGSAVLLRFTRAR